MITGESQKWGGHPSSPSGAGFSLPRRRACRCSEAIGLGALTLPAPAGGLDFPTAEAEANAVKTMS